jgi:hypothetical protein
MSRAVPTVAEYAQMTAALRREAAELMAEAQSAVNAQRARMGDRAAAEGVEQADVVREARALLPLFIGRHGDTPSLQARRRATLLADVYGRGAA